MSVPAHDQIRPGTLVSIALDGDSQAGHHVQGTVATMLATSEQHGQGVKVMLSDGRVGQVQEILQASNSSNIWSSSSSNSHNPPVSDPQNWQAHTSYPAGHPSSHMQNPPISDPQNWQAHTSFPSSSPSTHAQPHQPQHAYSHTSQAPLPDDTPFVPPEERSEQVEYMQSYENAKPASQDDANQATLQREFPNIDSSLIAALYGESKSVMDTRELLQELND